jgi:hypothetical protein
MKLDDRMFEGIIIATDTKGRNKVRFCESIRRRENLLTQQGFTIHDKVMFLTKLNKEAGLRYAVDCEFTHSDSKNVVLKALSKYDELAKRQLILKEIANRPKRNTDITEKDLELVLEQL